MHFAGVTLHNIYHKGHFVIENSSYCISDFPVLIENIYRLGVVVLKCLGNMAAGASARRNIGKKNFPRENTDLLLCAVFGVPSMDRGEMQIHNVE